MLRTAPRLAPLPSDNEPMHELIDRRARAFRRIASKKRAERWLPIHFNETQPFGVMWFGDPHLDDDSCNWPLLMEHVELCRNTPGMYGASIGDATNNWTGRLLAKYADQGTTNDDSRRLIKWFMKEAGIPWALWISGNHDLWREGEAIMSLISDGTVYLPGWEARVEFRTASDRWRVHAAHDFKGHSMWNKAHGALKASLLTSDAELYVSGHRHDWVTQSFERSGKGTVANLAMVRGYKWFDSWAVEKGFQQSAGAASMLTIFNPGATTAESRVLTFADPVMGAKVLTALRNPVSPPPCKKPTKRPAVSVPKPKLSPKKMVRKPAPKPSAPPKKVKKPKASAKSRPGRKR